MDNQNNLYNMPRTDMPPVNYPASQPVPAKPNSKKWVIGLGVGTAIIVALVIILVVMVNRPGDYDIIGEGDTAAATYSRPEDYSEILALFAHISDDMTEEVLREVMKAGNISESYLQVNPSGEATSYIALAIIDTNADYTGQNIEYISFTYLPAEDEGEIDRIDEVTYHSFHDGKYDTISKTSDYEYTHSYGDYANSFEELSEAIDDYLGRL